MPICCSYGVGNVFCHLVVAMVCGVGSTYTDCGDVCPPTCHSPLATAQCNPEQCVPQCRCGADMVLHAGECIVPEHCPCTYAGMEYERDAVIRNGCNQWCVVVNLHTYIHTYIHTHIHTYTHTYIHTYSYIL